MTLNPNDARPPYLQIADELRRAIQAGEYQPGEQLPSISELAERYGVARNTVQASLRVLRDADLVVAKHGKGVYVRTDAHGSDSSPDLHEIVDQLGSLSTLTQQLADRVTELEDVVHGRKRGQ